MKNIAKNGIKIFQILDIILLDENILIQIILNNNDNTDMVGN